jgi:hypothetical protein
LATTDKGAALIILSRGSSYSRIQLKWLTKTWIEHGRLRSKAISTGNGFTRKYTGADRRLLAELHNTQSSPATEELCDRA